MSLQISPGVIEMDISHLITIIEEQAFEVGELVNFHLIYDNLNVQGSGIVVKSGSYWNSQSYSIDVKNNSRPDLIDYGPQWFYSWQISHHYKVFRKQLLEWITLELVN